MPRSTKDKSNRDYIFSWDEFNKDHGPLNVMVRDMIDDGINSRSWLSDRWDILQRMYRMEPGSSGVQELLPGVEIYPSPLIPSRVDTTVRNVMGSVMLPTPWVSAIPERYDQVRADDLEEGFQTILGKCGFEYESKQVLRVKGIKGQSFFHVEMSEDGYVLSNVAPEDFAISPTYGATIETCDFAGHRSYVPYWEVKQRQSQKLEDGGWFDFPITGGDLPEENRSQSSPTLTDYSLVELWDGVIRVITEEGPKRLRVIFAMNQQQILLCEDYHYSTPWYVKCTDMDEYGEFWTGDSIAHRLQGFQHLHTTCHNLMPQAGIMGALPPIIISGGQISAKLKKYMMAALIETTSAVQAQALPMNADIRDFPMLIDQIERMADAATGITPNSTGQETSSDTTATETAVLNESAQVSKNDYTANFSRCVESLMKLMQEMGNKHKGTLKKAYGDCVKPNFFNALSDKVRWAVTGKTPEAMPGVALAKSQQLLAMAENPLSTLDYGKTEKVVVSMMRLPVDTDELTKTIDATGAPQSVLPDAGMGMAQGVLPGSMPVGSQDVGGGFSDMGAPSLDSLAGPIPGF